MQKTIGLVAIAIGVIMMIYTGFNYVTTEKVVDIGPIEINAEKSHTVAWPPILGGIFIIGGIVLVALDRKSRK